MKIIKGLLQTPALLIGILLVISSTIITGFAIKFNIEKDMLSLETLKYVYYSILGLAMLPMCGVGIKREIERIFIRGDK